MIAKCAAMLALVEVASAMQPDSLLALQGGARRCVVWTSPPLLLLLRASPALVSAHFIRRVLGPEY